MIDSPDAPGAWGCSGCGGVWAGIGTANRFVSTLDPAVKELANLTEHAARTQPTNPQLLQRRACPDCRCWLNAREIRGITLDVCNMHGTWFDRGELAAINGERRPEPAVPTSAGASSPPASSRLDGADIAIGAVALLFAFFDD